MLTELRIKDLGVIGDVSLVLGPGMTALTGETGAGKTMLVEAIELLVGGRADPVVVRAGAAQAEVEGRFVLDGEADDVVLGRIVPAEGRSRAYVDGRLAPAGALGERGAELVDLHGQHTHQSLLSASTQRAALDRFAGIDLGPLRAARAEVAAIDAELASMGGDERARARELDLLRYQVGELDAARLDDPEEDVALDAEEDVLADAVAHREAGAAAVAALTDDGGAVDAIGVALSAVTGRRPFAALEERLRGAAADVGDIAAELRAATEAVDEDPERLARIRERRQLLHELRRKYGETLADVLAYGDQIRARLAELVGHDQRAAALDKERSAALDRLEAEATVVAAARREAAPRFAAAVQSHLAELAMGKAVVAVDVRGEPPGDDVAFLLAANPGSPPAPLAKVASGGELARAMLAVRLVLAGTDAGTGPSTLVFDEVDAGIGGAAALAVGRALAALAGPDRQVLVVTHLPQVAACADTQVVVVKDDAGAVTTATADVVEGDDRVVELSRMLAGTPESATTRRAAAELLETAGGPALMARRRRTELAPIGPALVGPARVDRRTKNLVKRLRPGDVAIIDHEDLDRVAAETLVEREPCAVVNASASISGRYPNVGPLLLAAAGIPVLDAVGAEVMEAVEEGAPVAIVGDDLVVSGDVVASGRRHTLETLEAAYEEAERNVGVELERFVQNTVAYIVEEAPLFTRGGLDVPDVDVDFRGRHVLLVVRGSDYREDLQLLRRSGYLGDKRPVLVGVDGGADALVELGFSPDVIIGDFDSVSERALQSGAALVVHAYSDGRAPGAKRLDDLGLEYQVFLAPGTSEDVAMLLANHHGAELIVAVGTHTSMVDFLDKGRSGMASTVLVRMLLGPKLVDAKGVSRLYQTQVRARDLAMMVVAALGTVVAFVIISEPVQLLVQSLWDRLT